MHGEAFAYVKYLLYAEHARKSGNKELADLFEKTANTERFEHFAEEAQLAGLVGSDAENLRDAIKGESYEIDIMYLEFAGQAKAAGDTAAAARFEEIRHDEIGHRDASSRRPPSGPPFLFEAVPAAVDPKAPQNAFPFPPWEPLPIAAALSYETSRAPHFFPTEEKRPEGDFNGEQRG